MYTGWSRRGRRSRDGGAHLRYTHFDLLCLCFLFCFIISFLLLLHLLLVFLFFFFFAFILSFISFVISSRSQFHCIKATLGNRVPCPALPRSAQSPFGFSSYSPVLFILRESSVYTEFWMECDRRRRRRFQNRPILRSYHLKFELRFDHLQTCWCLISRANLFVFCWFAHVYACHHQ